MIAYTAFLLFFIIIFSSVKVGIKMDRALSGVGFVSLFFVFCNFLDGMREKINDEFSFVWNTAQGQNLRIDIFSNAYNYELVLPFFAITLLAVLNGLLFRNEERRASYAAVEIFNLLALIVLITSSNFVQLLASLFSVDILSYFLVRDIDKYKRYVLINVFADMILFMVLAIINCRVDSLDIQQIILYRQEGFYNNFVALSGLTAVFLKIGFTVFQIGIMGLKNIRWHRLQNILFVSSATASFLVLLKFSILWKESVCFDSYFNFMALASFVWAFIGSLLTDEFKTKLIYWQMLFFALFAELLRINGFVWERGFTILLLEMYLMANVLYLVYYYNNRRNLLAKMAAIRRRFDKKVAAVLLLTAVFITAMANTLTMLYNRGNRYYIWLFGVMFVLSLSAAIKRIYFSPRLRMGDKQNQVSFKFLYVAELAAAGAFLLYGAQFGKSSVWGFLSIFIALCLISPLGKIPDIKYVKFLQNGDYLGDFYLFLIKSIRRSGKMLWLIIDHFFMEKIILRFSSVFVGGQLRWFRKVHNSRLWGGTTAVVVLLILLWFSFKNGGLG